MTVLAVVAHPDDEVLGVGGTLARHAREGERVEVLILADGETARGGSAKGKGAKAKIAARQGAARMAAKALGIRPPRFSDFPDNRLDSLDLIDVVKRIELVMAEIKPAIVYTHYAHDLNIDHRIVHQAVVTACRPMPGSSVQAIYAFETPSSTEWAAPSSLPQFAPVRFVNIEQALPAKRAALKAYANEMREFPHPRSLEAIEALGRWRGATAGFRAAEAFEIVRERLP
jgi:N-acetylglucosamine malate deacetylase 1